MSFHVIHACALVSCSLSVSPHPSFYFLVLFLFQLYLMSNSVPDEFSIEDPLCNSSLGSMVTLDYVTPLTSTAHHPVYRATGLPHSPPSETQRHRSRAGFHRTGAASVPLSVVQLPVVLWAWIRHGCSGPCKEISQCVALRLHLALHRFQFVAKRTSSTWTASMSSATKLMKYDNGCTLFKLERAVIMWCRQEKQAHITGTGYNGMSETL